MKAGLGFGGPCFPRDLRFFLNYMRKEGLNPPLLKAVGKSNQEHASELVRQIQKQAGLLRGRKVALIGLSYKPGVKNFEDSFSLRLARELIRTKAKVFAYDPLLESSASLNGLSHVKNVTLKKSIPDVLKGAEVCVLAHPASEFQNLKQKDFAGMAQPFIFDPWGTLPT